MTVIHIRLMSVIFNRRPDVHRSKHGEDVRLKNRYQQFKNVHEQSEGYC